MRSRILALLIFVILSGVAAVAAQERPELHLPAAVTASDHVPILVEGQGCEPLINLPEVMGNRILVRGRTLLPLMPCSDLPWVEPVGVPPLPPGDYTVELLVEGSLADRRELRVLQAPTVLSLDPDPAGSEESLYEISLQWELPGDTPQAAYAGFISSSSGYFWFFAPTNPEVMVKMVDGTLVNGKDWLFISSNTTLPFSVHVSHCIQSDPPHCQVRDFRYEGGSRRAIVDLTLE